MLVKQHRLGHTCLGEILVVINLTLGSFLRAFDHTIHDKTDSDKLYYLEQFTRGEARDLIRSCQHMSPFQGYNEARKLLIITLKRI